MKGLEHQIKVLCFALQVIGPCWFLKIQGDTSRSRKVF